jgi:hypothetical protein
MRRSLWVLSALGVCVLPVAVRAQWPGSNNPWQGNPGMPSMSGGVTPLGQPWLGGVNPWQGGLGTPSVNGSFGPFGRVPLPIPGAPRLPPGYGRRLGATPMTLYPDPFACTGPAHLPRIPTQADLFKDLQNAPILNPQRGNLEFSRPTTFSRIPQGLLRTTETPKFNLSSILGGSSQQHEPLHVPSWMRWECAAGLFGLSLVAGLLYGYFGRKSAGA